MQPAHDLEPGPPSSPSSARAGDTGGLEPGMRISHNIRLVQLLGAGGMGSVWLADHAGLDTQVAVKFMAHELASDSSTAMRFAREAKLAARIKSPHVVQIFDYATTAEGVPFIVMELLEGEDLESRLASGRPLSLEETSRILIQICKALGRAHALGIVHRDIKPDNVFLLENDGDTFIKVLDFGIARDERRLPGVTVSGMTMGTPSYMSPEQLFFAKDVDLRSDIWATAVVIYRCITGKLPFEGDSFGSICVAINSGGFRPPSTLSDDVPPALDAWFKRALARHKDARFESAAEMANAYLATLERAGLLPQWALARHSRGEVPSYATDPGGLSGTPLSLCPRRRITPSRIAVVGACSLAIGALSTFAAKARYPEIVTAARNVTMTMLGPLPDWIMPRLARSDDEPSSRAQDELMWRTAPTRAASAERDLPEANRVEVPHEPARAPEPAPLPLGEDPPLLDDSLETVPSWPAFERD